MPDLESPLHLDMLRRSSKLSRSLPVRILRAIKKELRSDGGIYGMEWGDPDTWDPLTFIRDHYILPYVRHDQVAVEIGPGGGRWTKYLLGFGKIYAVDYHNELLCELKKRYRKQRHIEFVKNNGMDFPGVADASVNYLFSFGTFVHLDFNIIEAYLDSIRSLLSPGANAIIQYSDKNKVMARRLGDYFTDNNPDRMRAAVECRGYTVLQEDTTTLWHSSVIRFTI